MSHDELSKRYLTISQSQTDAIITSDASKTISSWNKGAEKLFGYTESEMLGQLINKIIPQRFHAKHALGMDNLIAGGSPRVLGTAVELSAIHKDGHEFPIELTLGSWSSGTEIYFSGIIRDISERKKAEQIIQDEKRKSEALLRNILPANIVDELKVNGRVEPKSYENVSIIFTDIVGFTGITESLDATHLVHELNVMFSRFDNIIKKRGLEKIKTIGDAYMCAGGLPEENETHALDAVLAAIQFQGFVKSRRKHMLAEYGIDWNIRVGIHTGPVIAGVVGDWKYTYDIWGDSVNTAARMEESGISGMINISQATYEKVKDFFDCSHRGQIEAKNKNKLDMYLINNFKEELSVDNKGKQPDDRFYKKYNELEEEVVSVLSFA